VNSVETSPHTHRPVIAPDESDTGPQRSLILAGGGIRVAYQAGVIRALHEAGLRFAHGDGASGGILNLAMLCSGLDPVEICQRWSDLNPRDSISLLPLHRYLRPHALAAFGDADGLVDKVFPHLGIDVDRINAVEGMEATFNVCNVSRKTNVALTHREVTRDLLVAGVSLPMFLPAVEHEGELYLDSVWIRDANLMEAVRRGAQELWVVWCIGNTSEYADGTFNQYVHMIELSANGALYEEFDRIAELNERIIRGDSPFGQQEPIRLHLIRPEYPLPLDPDYYLSHIDGPTLIAQGYADAMRYLESMPSDGLPYQPDITRMRTPGRGITFRERMSGPFKFGLTDPRQGSIDGADDTMTLHLTANIRDLKQFIADPQHTGELVGSVDLTSFGTGLPCRAGTVRLFAPTESPSETRMVYEIGFIHDGKDYTVVGEKDVRRDSGFDVWADTTTLFTRLHEGRDRSGPVVGAGVLHISISGLARMLLSFFATGVTSLPERVATTGQFGLFFASELWNVYGPGAGSRRGAEVSVNPDGSAATPSKANSIRFTETMRGFVAFGEDDPSRGLVRGRQSNTSLLVRLTIRVDDTHRFITEPDHAAVAEGWVESDAFGGRLPVEKGAFNLFVDNGDPKRKQMRYLLHFHDTVGHPLTLSGYKVIENNLGADIWPDTTTLYTRILQGHVPDRASNGSVTTVAAGVLRIHPVDFARQMTTFRTGGSSLRHHVTAIGHFGGYWLRNIAKVYGGDVVDTASV
jgi:predicted acylesterase/phospholipase RssA